jgi:hypothetical protein
VDGNLNIVVIFIFIVPILFIANRQIQLNYKILLKRLFLPIILFILFNVYQSLILNRNLLLIVNIEDKMSK